jgi:60 kDa SS-A/Ro ribonucleoprotein
MARLNILKLGNLVPWQPRESAHQPHTHEGAPAAPLTPMQSLRRSVMACMLWENEFYESGQTIASRIAALVPQVSAVQVAALAVEARERMHLRHVPLLLVREMARHASHRMLVADTLARVIQRADELTEFVAIYWKDGRQPLSAQVKRGLAHAFTRFDAYALAKYDRDTVVTLRDVLFLSHARPINAAQDALWKQLIAGTLQTPETWEVRLSAIGTNIEQKRAAWESLLREHHLGALALLRNLRNMQAAAVDPALVAQAIAGMSTDRVLPFRFLAAARHAPQWEPQLEQAMLAALHDVARLAGRTVLLVDVSGSMDSPLSQRSELCRVDAACGLAVLLRELCDEVEVYSFSSHLVRVPRRRGFALCDAIVASQPHGSTELGHALAALRDAPVSHRFDRIIVITDEQSHDRVPPPLARGYMVNVASAQHGVGYAAWTHIDGWSEAVVDYIRGFESESSMPRPQ